MLLIFLARCLENLAASFPIPPVVLLFIYALSWRTDNQSFTILYTHYSDVFSDILNFWSNVKTNVGGDLCCFIAKVLYIILYYYIHATCSKYFQWANYSAGFCWNLIDKLFIVPNWKIALWLNIEFMIYIDHTSLHFYKISGLMLFNNQDTNYGLWLRVSKCLGYCQLIDKLYFDRNCKAGKYSTIPIWTIAQFLV